MFLFFLAAWRRPAITEICFMGIQRLRKAFPAKALCVISEVEMIPLCKKYDIEYVVYKNLPVGEKKNFGLTEAMKRKWDVMVELGSDDILKDGLLEAYQQLDNPVLSLNHFCYINSEDLECRRVKNSTSYGIGRAIRRDVIEKHCKGVPILAEEDLMSPGRTTARGQIGFFPKDDADAMERVSYCKIIGEESYKLWNDNISKGLDNNSMFFLATQGALEKRVQFDDPIAIDIKSHENIWPFNPEFGDPIDLEAALKGLSDQEKTAIRWLKKAS